MTAFSNIHDTVSYGRLVAYVGYFSSVPKHNMIP